MSGILFDLDGVLYLCREAIPGAAAAVAWVRSQQLPHLFLTNTTSLPRHYLVERLAGYGIQAEPESILTPPVAAANWLRTQVQGPVALFVPEKTLGEYAGIELLDPQAESGAAAVVIGDLGRRWDFNTLNRAFRLLMQEPRPRLVALGMTRYWRAYDGLRLDVAAFVAALEHASGVQAEVLGKPAPAFYRDALAQLGTAAAQTVMVGDDIQGDIRGAQEAGLRAVLVQTGKFRPEDLNLGILPDAVLPSVAAFPCWWLRQ